MDSFFSSFSPFISGPKLRKIFEAQDCSDPGIILSLSRPELDALLENHSLGLKKRIWEAIQKWRKDEADRKKNQIKASDRRILLPELSEADSDSDSDVCSGLGPSSRRSSPYGQESLSQPGKDGGDDTADDQEVNKCRSRRKKDDLLASNNGSATSVSHGGNGSSSSTFGSLACPSCLLRNRHGYALSLEPERWKTVMAFLYVLVVSWLTAFVMVIVHDRVPDMQRYPPLPDILLDNLPHIPWAFEMCELTGMVLMVLWTLVCIFHKHRFILMRRFFSISGTIFLLRCVTMLITSLSVPGKHLDCAPRPYGDLWNKLYNAYVIWTGAGMTLQGVRTCGDYMFSGHTVSLTLLNFFITEYTTRRIFFLHTFTWICNVFGIFFILAAHEHYSIDVFIAFYISSRLFLYYHTLANNKGYGNSKVNQKAWFYFPLFYFFEHNVDGRVPNEFEWPITVQDIKDYAQKINGRARDAFGSLVDAKPQPKVTSTPQDKKSPSKKKHK